jgi:hypothetical protein
MKTNPVQTHELHRCASPTCPGLPYRASELAHPPHCGAPPPVRIVDVVVTRESTIFLFRPLSDTGRDWIEEKVADPLWFGEALVVDQHYAMDLFYAMGESGLEVQVPR